MPLYTYTCPSGHSHDAIGALASASQRQCPECDQEAERESLYRVALVGEARVPPDQRQHSLKDFKEATAELEHDFNKAQNSAGQELQPPSYWKESQRQARELKKKGVQDGSDFRDTADGEVKYRNRWLGTKLVNE